jgi:nucleoid-associated protein YgaU
MLSNNTKPRRIHHRAITAAAVAGVGIALPLLAGTTAHAASSSVWERVANCESSGNWSIDTGNGYYGGLQFTESTWLAYGGGSYAQYANGASESQQIAIAQKVLAAQGVNAWPVCGPAAGLTSADASGSVAVTGSSNSSSYGSNSSTTTSASTPSSTPDTDDTSTASTASTTSSSTGGNYTVASGDTLSNIATAHHVAGGWEKLYSLNKSVVGSNANLIFPGQHLVF